jgi:hypothetical protein
MPIHTMGSIHIKSIWAYAQMLKQTVSHQLV